jgi:hypothetical protein
VSDKNEHSASAPRAQALFSSKSHRRRRRSVDPISRGLKIGGLLLSACDLTEGEKAWTSNNRILMTQSLNALVATGWRIRDEDALRRNLSEAFTT